MITANVYDEIEDLIEKLQDSLPSMDLENQEAFIDHLIKVGYLLKLIQTDTQNLIDLCDGLAEENASLKYQINSLSSLATEPVVYEGLTLNQQFEVRSTQVQIADYTKEQLLEAVLILQTALFKQGNVYKELIGLQWGLFTPEEVEA
jgi:hypothetical protein